MQMVRLDEKTRTVWFQAQGREPGEDPYFRHCYRIGLDGKGYTPLTPVAGDHAVQLSPSGRYLVDTYSQPDVEPAVAAARRRREVRDDAREGGHLEAAGRPAGSRRCRSR